VKLLGAVLEQAESSWARGVELARGKAAPSAAHFFDDALPGFHQDPVFIIPGLTADRWMYRRGKEMLEAEGFVVGGPRMPWHGWGGIPGDARSMRDPIMRTIDRARGFGRDVERVQIVGDSEGGLIGRWFMQFEDGLPLVGRYVSNGTPHGGIRPLGSDNLASLGQKLIMPAGVKDLLTSSPVMHELNEDWPAFLAYAHETRPDWRAHAIASRAVGFHHDGLVPEHAARLAGEAPQVTNYTTGGAHSINLAFGRRQSEAGNVLLSVLGSEDDAARQAAMQANAQAQAAEGASMLQMIG
jgi:hypothetical protein